MAPTMGLFSNLLLSAVCASTARRFIQHDFEIQHSLLQVKKKTAALRDCPLPEDATWAEVRLKGLPSFQMAVHASSDLVSQTILQDGFWEVEDPAIWGRPGQALDIGGNIGYYTFSLANAGWKVTTFEPMRHNIALIEATLCQNPNLAERIKLFTFGLGAANQVCMMNVARDNRGNGVVRCSEADVNDAEWERLNFVQAGSFQLRRLQEVLQDEHISNIDFIKIDVEGYECEVMKGAGGPWFLQTFKPRLIKSEVWKDMERCTSLEYFAMFESTGYRIGMDADPACQQSTWKEDQDWANTTKYWAAGANFYMCRDE